MSNLPLFISIIFILTTLVSVFLFYKAANYSKTVLAILIVWLVLQSAIGLTGFYTVTDTLPPRFLALVMPPLAIIIVLFLTSGGKKFIAGLNMKTLTILHIVRIPVELVLFWLFIYKTVPQLMTFEGRNLDILSGLSAPLVFYFGMVKKQLSSRILLLWNIVCLVLLVNVVVHGILSVPFPFQQFAFEQPNIALLYFPFLFLPGCIVPLVLFSHLVSIRQLLQNSNK